jgi:hypothetical protein
MSSPNATPNVNNVEDNMWDNITNNYEYLYEIKMPNDQIISFEGKKYGHKNLFMKKINNVIGSEVYIFYNDVFVKKDDIWVEDNTDAIKYAFDERYLDIEYIKLLIADAELMESKTNFDGSNSDIYVYNNLNIDVLSEKNVIEKISILDSSLYQITLQYKNINQVEDFVVEK